jgi:hypothetical protein
MKSFKAYVNEAKGKLVKNMRVKHIHNGNKGTVVKGGDRAGGRVEVEYDNGQTVMVAGKYLEPLKEEAPANATGPTVDMNPTGKPKKMDKRSKYHVEKMYKRNRG